MKNLVGQTVTREEKRSGEMKKRTWQVTGIEKNEGVRFYQVVDVDTGLPSIVNAKAFDSFFLVKREVVKSRRYRDKISNKSQADYKK